MKFGFFSKHRHLEVAAQLGVATDGLACGSLWRPQLNTGSHSQANYVPEVAGATVLGFYVLVSDISLRKRMEDELRVAKRVAEHALAEVKTLRGLLPMCAWCRKIRDPKGYWDELEKFLINKTDASLTHGMCEACAAKLLPDGSS